MKDTNAYEVFHQYVDKKCSSKYMKKADIAILKAMDNWAKEGPIGNLEDLEEYLYEAKNGKKSIQRLLLEFYESQGIETTLQDVVIIQDQVRRIVEEIKYLHDPHSRRELQQHFGISESALRNDLKVMQNELTVLGNRYDVSLENKHKNLHLDKLRQPIFLMLDEAQCSALTKGLWRVVSLDPLYAEIYEATANIVYQQFSETMKGKVGPFPLESEKPLQEDWYKLGLIQMLDEGKAGLLVCEEPGVGVVDLNHCHVLAYNIEEKSIQIQKEDGSTFWTPVKKVYMSNVEDDER